MTDGATHFLGVTSGGERIEVVVAIGHPYPTSEGGWACPVEVDGLHGDLAEIHGVDSLQALCLAIRLVGERLAAFVADGGRILHPSTGESVALESYFILSGTKP
jgi:hypothetical protein